MDLSRYRSIFLFLAIINAFFTLTSVSVLDACTLWSAAGKRVAYGGSLIAKNRDWTPEPSAVRLVHPNAGFRSLGLFPIRDGKQTGIVAGVNEKGLVVVTATASSIPEADREKGGRGLTRQLLAVFSTVEDVLENKSVFSRAHPSMYLIADSRRVAWIEVAPGGRFSFLFLGEIPRRTPFETGLPNAYYEEGGVEKKDIIDDDTSLVMNLKGKGLIILSGCAHSGIINTVTRAREVTGIDTVHVIMGGFHLNRAPSDPLVVRTIEALRKIGPGISFPHIARGEYRSSRSKR